MQVSSEAGPEVRISPPAVRYSVPSGRAGAEQGTAPTQASPLSSIWDIAQVAVTDVVDFRPVCFCHMGHDVNHICL